MSNLVSSIFGGGAQEKLLKKQQRELDAVEDGQRRLREGGRGLLAFVDEELGGALGTGTRRAARTFGGVS